MTADEKLLIQPVRSGCRTLVRLAGGMLPLLDLPNFCPESLEVLGNCEHPPVSDAI